MTVIGSEPITHKNRYGDVYTFTEDEDGNILWEGPFLYCRNGFPNDYTKAYDAYVNDLDGQQAMNISDFIKEVTRYDSDNGGYTDIGKKYSKEITTLFELITMVDPSGGPYLSSDMAVESISEELTGLVIDRFESVETGWKIFLKNG